MKNLFYIFSDWPNVTFLSPFFAFCTFFPCSLTVVHRGIQRKSGGRQWNSWIVSAVKIQFIRYLFEFSSFQKNSFSENYSRKYGMQKIKIQPHKYCDTHCAEQKNICQVWLRTCCFAMIDTLGVKIFLGNFDIPNHEVKSFSQIEPKIFLSHSDHWQH